MAGIVVAYYVGQGLRATAQQAVNDAAERARVERINRALAYTTRWQDPQLASARAVLRQTVQRFEDRPERLAEAAKKRAFRARVQPSLIACFNILEDVALALGRGVVDDSFVYGYYRTIIPWCWEGLKPWVAELREHRNEPHLYTELERLAYAWRARGDEVSSTANGPSGGPNNNSLRT